MKRKRATYRRFKPVAHAVADRSRPDAIERHVEVHTCPKRHIGGHTVYRKGSAVVSSLPRSDMEENLHPPTSPSTEPGVAFNDDAPASTNGVRPEKVSRF